SPRPARRAGRRRAAPAPPGRAAGASRRRAWRGPARTGPRGTGPAPRWTGRQRSRWGLPGGGLRVQVGDEGDQDLLGGGPLAGVAVDHRDVRAERERLAHLVVGVLGILEPVERHDERDAVVLQPDRKSV